MSEKQFLTKSAEFRDVSRGKPKPFTLAGDGLVKALLTPETWRLEIVSDGSTKIENHAHDRRKAFMSIQRLKLTGAAILVLRGTMSLQAAPAAYPDVWRLRACEVVGRC